MKTTSAFRARARKVCPAIRNSRSHGRVSLAEIAARLYIGKGTASRLVREKIIPSEQVGGRPQVRRNEYEDWEFAFGDSAMREDFWERRRREAGV